MTRGAAKKQADESAEIEQSQTAVEIQLTAESSQDKSATAASTPTASKGAKAGKKVKFPCGKCDGEVTCGVACNSCDVWFHDKCVEGMTKEYFDNCLKALDLYGYSSFLCKVCKKMFQVVNKLMRDTKSDLKKMEDRIKVLELEKEVLAEKVEKLEKGAEKVKERVEGVEKEVVTGMAKAKEEVKNDVKTEMTLREENSSNICIYGLPESKEDDAEKWRESEKTKVKEVTDQLGIQVNGEIAVKFRSGRMREEGAKPRPLIVKVTDDETREKIFQNARMLSREERTRRIFISPDMTPQQREEDRKAELARKENAAKRTEEAKNEERRVRYLVVGARGKRRVVERALEEEANA